MPSHQQHPLAQALTGTDIFALSQSPDGRTSYNKINVQDIIPGTDVESCLPRETWTKHALRRSAQCVDVDCSQHSTVSAADCGNGIECPICMEELVEGDLVSRFVCSHSMHFECANQWLSSRIRQGQVGTCPMCNFVVLAPVFGSAAIQSDSQITTQQQQQVRRASFPICRAFLQGLPRQVLSHLSRLCGGTNQRTSRVLTSDPDTTVQTNIPAMVLA